VTTDLNTIFNTGLVLGTLLKHGIEAEPEIDGDGNYTTQIWIPILKDEEGRSELRVLIEVVGAPAATDPRTVTDH
jgi:hypothetical protein